MEKVCLVMISSVLALRFTINAQKSTQAPTPLPTTVPKLVGDNFSIIEPYPENIYPIEFTSAKVTCVAFDSSGVKTPERIEFLRKDNSSIYTSIKASDNIYFTSQIEEVNHHGGKNLSKLFVTLNIRNVTVDDDGWIGPLGRYECHAYAVDDPQEKKRGFAVNVIRRSEIPEVSISKFGVLNGDDKVTIVCNVTQANDGKGPLAKLKTISWFKDDFRVQSVRCPVPNEPEGTLRPLLVKDGGNYTCVLEVLLRGVKTYKVSDYTVIKYTPLCPEESSEGVSWSVTSRGVTDLKSCPNGAIGTASRECSEDGQWKKANFTDCSSPEFNKLNNEVCNYTRNMEAIMKGNQSDLKVHQVLSQLVNASAYQQTSNRITRPPQIYGKDLVIAVDILRKIAEYNGNYGTVSSTEHLNNFAQVASILLESTNSKTWKELEKAGEGRSQTLVKAMDEYGLGVAATFNETTKPEVVKTKNLVMRIDRVGQNSPIRVNGLEVSFKKSSIYLPPQAFSSAQESHVVTLIYLTLNDVLLIPNEDEKEDDQPLSGNTAIASSTVDPKPPDVLSNPVKVVLENKKLKSSVSFGVPPQEKCMFWRPRESAMWKTGGCRLVIGESNVDVTTCECDHLTVFAALMDPYGLAGGKSHKAALEIISTVGCSISLVAVFITMAVTVFFWRALKGPRAEVLLNLCAAIAFVCALVIFEGSARDKVACPIVAVLLHYSLLALFSWMLCEGVLHYILLVKVLGGGAQDEVKYFYMFGWGFPAVVVAISLAVTQTDGYGNKEACWLDVKSGLIWGFIGPALLIILINIEVFVLVIFKMMGTVSMQAKAQTAKVRAGVKASTVILPLLGITWLFGLLSFSSETIAFKYIFAICNSLQGLMIFILHCALNKQVKDAIRQRREKRRRCFITNPGNKPDELNTFPPNQAKKGRSHQAQTGHEQLQEITEFGFGKVNPLCPPSPRIVHWSLDSND